MDDSAAPRLIPIREIAPELCRDFRFFFTDIDDTLTADGLLPAASLEALYRLREAGLAVVPVTGRPAGWCDHIARMWPVAAVIGENGAFYFSYDRGRKRMRREFSQTPAERRSSARALRALARSLGRRFPALRPAADQAFRLTDYALDISEDREAWPREEIDAVCAFLKKRGAHFKISSIHLNVWQGDYDKQTCLFKYLSDAGAGSAAGECFYIGDSPNDEPLFAALPETAAVANLRPFLSSLTHLPKYLAERPAAAGFQETAAVILERRSAKQ